MLNLISRSLFRTFKRVGPLKFLTAGSLTTFFVIKGLRLLAERSKTVDKALHTGFDVVEDKIGNLKGQVLPEERLG